MSLIPLLSGLTLLVVAWLGPLPDLSRESFAAHMTLHIALVALVAPLVAWGIADSQFNPARLAPALFAPIPASIVELMVVWGWHAPVLHHAARMGGTAFLLEQATFLGAGMLLWLASVAGARAADTWRAGAGVGALLFTSIHMTLLGALFALTPRPLYAHGSEGALGLSQLTDQQLGGAIMLLIGGASYMIGGLWLTARLLRDSHARAIRARSVTDPGAQSGDDDIAGPDRKL
jgi:putative membrane protein